LLTLLSIAYFTYRYVLCLTQTPTFFPAHKQVAINWCISKGTVPIPGARSLKQAEENLGAIGWRLALAEVEALDAAAEKVPRELVQVLKGLIKKEDYFLCFYTLKFYGTAMRADTH
jgi:hypothetical protein